jgi:hypothetical protein
LKVLSPVNAFNKSFEKKSRQTNSTIYKALHTSPAHAQPSPTTNPSQKPNRHPLPSKGGKVVSREQHQVQCGASEEIQLFSHNKRLQEGSARKAQSDQEAKLYQCLHVNEVLAVASSSSSPPKNNDEPGPKKSHTAQQERSFESKRENPTKYNTKPGNSDKEVFQSFVDSNNLIHS